MRLGWLRRWSRPDHMPSRSFVMDAVWERSEELRPDRLGPTQDDVVNPEMYRVKDRPLRTLGPFKTR